MKRWTKVVGPPNLAHDDYDTIVSQYDEWHTGMPKNIIERRDYNDPKSHGKLMSQLFRDVLGVETEQPSVLQLKLWAAEEEIVRLNRRIEELLQRGRHAPM